MGATKRMTEQEQNERINTWINSHQLPQIELEGFNPKKLAIIEKVKKIFDSAIFRSAKANNQPF